MEGTGTRQEVRGLAQGRGEHKQKKTPYGHSLLPCGPCCTVALQLPCSPCCTAALLPLLTWMGDILYVNLALAWSSPLPKMMQSRQG